MCGIAGIIHWDKSSVDTTLLQQMGESMRHRGPDDDGIQAGPGWGFVHRRLSIIDLSKAGRQPMSNEDGSIWLVFNGEIYNYSSIRKELQSRGHIFKSRTDCEILLHGHEEWGFEKLLNKINGMYAFAIWDSNVDQLLLARDPFGKKPIFVWNDNHRIIFASTLQALMQTNLDWQIDLRSLTEYFSYCFIPEDSCVLEGVKKLLPGNSWIFTKTRNEVKSFWQLNPIPKVDDDIEESENKVKELLIQSVGRRLNSDVPLGAFLSGGVDSSLVCWAMREHLDEVYTYTISMGNHSWDEKEYAQEVATFLGTKHEVLQADPQDISLLETIVDAYSEPFGDSSALPSLLVAKLAKDRVSVVLTGDGGDELFAGYPRVWKAYIAGVWRSRIGRLGGKVFTLLGEPLQYFPGLAGDYGKRMKTFGHFVRDGSPAQYFSNPYIPFLQKNKILGPMFNSVLSNYDPSHVCGRKFDLLPADNEAERMMWHDLHFRLTSDYLTKVDSATMYYGLEARSPFLDIELWYYAARLKTEVRMNGDKRKGFLSDLALKLLPEKAINRPKQGFGIPFYQWLRGPWYQYWRDLFSSSRACQLGFLNDKGILELLDEHCTGSDHSIILWNLAIFELWLRKNRF